MGKPTFDVNSEAYLQYKWIVSVIEPYTDGLSIDTTDEDSDIETTTVITLEKKISGKSSVIMKTEEKEITIYWNGERLSATIFNEETQDSDKLEVPEALIEIIETLKDTFGISQDESSDESIDDNEDEDIKDDLSNDPEDDKPDTNSSNEEQEERDVEEDIEEE